MKNYILTLTVSLLLVNAAQSATPCNLNLMVKKADSKTAYTAAGDTISKSMIIKLSKVCTITKVKMSDSMNKAMKIKRLKKQLAKLSK